MTYPKTTRLDVVETHFGQTITDPYRWLENDVHTNKDVAAWVESQNRVTHAYLATLPARDIFKSRLKQLFNYERFTIPIKKGNRYFYLRNSGVQNQRVFYVRGAVDGEGRVLIDPNTWANDGADALAEWAASHDGKHVAYAVQHGGADGRTIKVLDVDTATELPDEIKWAKFTTIVWATGAGKGWSGFFYTRFPEPKQGVATQASMQNHKLFLMTNQDAPRYRVLTVDMAAAKPAMTALLPEQDALMNGASLVGGRLMVMYLVDMKTEVRRYTLEGKLDAVVKLPGIGTAIGFDGTVESSETFYGFTSFNAPGIIYLYDVASDTARVWSEAKVAMDLTQIAVEQRFYQSKDGTRIPMFLVRRKDASGALPTMLYAYGGYGLIDVPGFSPGLLAWVEQGGVFAVAYIRGGGEYGRAWHEAGRRDNKQNVFDDFIAAGDYLKAQGITTADGLAIQGASNGGLLMGAAVNQRPDLFAAALVQVGVLDMLRFDKFTGGKLWVGEYGDPAKEADFRNLLKYSPYHNIQPGNTYPAILATTADADDRVVPGHTFKYVAALQAADIGSKPHLARIDTRAGHGAGKPTDKVIDETADMWAFAARWTGLVVEPVT